MTTADQLSIVERRLGGEASAVALADGGLVQGWMKTRRMLVLVRREGQHALMVFVSASYPVSEEADLSLETALPVDAEFRCEIDSGDSAVLLKVSRGARAGLMFEMLPGFHTQNFVSEIYRVTEMSAASGEKGGQQQQQQQQRQQEQRGGSPALAWAAKYLSPGAAAKEGEREQGGLSLIL